MNKRISDTAPLRTVETLIQEAKALGLRVVHRPDSNVVNLQAYAAMQRQQQCVSPEAA